MTEQFSNFAQTTIAAPVGISDTSITVVSTANFATSFPYRITVTALNASSLPLNPEIMIVTAASGNVLTVTRAQEGTTAQAHAIGEIVSQSFTAAQATKIFAGSTNTLAGYDSTGAFQNSIAIGSGLSLAGGTLTCTVTSPVQSVFGRTGAVVAQTGDYAFSQISGSVANSQMATSTVNTLAGYNNTGVFSDVTIGSGLSLSGGVLSSTGGGNVNSVFGRTGNVVATSGDYNTLQVTENTNLYFTNGRAIASTLTGYISGVGVISSSDSVLSAVQKLNGNIGALVTGVSSVFGRTGNVVAAANDYAFSQISGTASVAQGGTGQTTYTNGQLLIGNTTGNTLTKATLTAGANITITNSTGSITIASTSAVSSVFGRTGAVTAQASDYAAYYGQLAASNNWTGASNIFSGFLQAETLESLGASYPSPANPINLANSALYQLILDDGRGNGDLRIFSQNPGNYVNFLQTDSAGNWVSRMTMGDPVDGTITFSSIVWDNAVFIVGGRGAGFGNAYIRITTNTGQGVELGDTLGGQVNVNKGTVFVNQSNYGGSHDSNQIFAVCDNAGGFALQVTLADANGWGQYVQTINNVLDDGSGNATFLGLVDQYSTTGSTGQVLTADGSGRFYWGSAGASVAFSAITGGTNTTAAMVVGAGASLNFTSTGTINASSLGGATFGAPGAIGGTTAAAGKFTTLDSGAHTITSTSATALAVGANGTTNPVFTVNTNTSSVATGISVTGAAAGSGVAIGTLSSGTNEALSISAKGNGNIQINPSGLGGVAIGNAGAGTITLNGLSLLRLQVGGTNCYQITGTQHIFAQGASSATAANVRFGYTGFADTTLTASIEAPSTYFNMAQTRQHATGALTLQRDFRISGTTHSFVGASTATDVAALAIDNYAQAGTNATITNAHGILIQAQAVAGTVGTANAIAVNAPTGATTNWAINVQSGNVNIAGSLTTGSTTLHTTSVSLTDGSGSSAGTLTNAPAIGNPTKWIPINDNGTTRYIPAW